VAVENDSYCAQADTQRWAQMGTYVDGGTPSKPSLAEVLVFQANRAGEVYAVLADVMGADAPGPAAYGTTIDTSTDVGLALDAVCKRVNAIGAAADALEASGAGEQPSGSDRVARLLVLYSDGLESLRSAALMYQGYASRTSTHISSGEIIDAHLIG
jgi:hypothetical protein